MVGRQEPKASESKAVKIRTAQAKDAPRLAELSGQLGYPATRSEILRRLPRLVRDHEHVVFVAEAGGKAIAWAHAFVCHLLEADPQAEVSGVVVDEAHRSSGVGRLLMEAVEHWAREKSCWAVRLRSNVIRERAHGFYERLGYETVKTQRVFRKVLALLLVAAFGAAAAMAAPQQDVTGTLRHGGRERTYRVHIPRGYERGKPAPLVLALHGGGGQGSGMVNLTHLNDVADRNGFLVVYPDGLYRHWNDGRQSGAVESRRIDDVGFLSALIDRLVKDYGVDPKRVYSTGISNGGFMSQRLACDLADKVAAVAVVAATMGRDLSARCKPARPVSVLLMQGTEDPLVPFEGGRVQVRGGGAIISAPDTVKQWVGLNGCAANPEMSDLPDRAADGTKTHQETYRNCQQGTEVVFLRIEGGGHTWPGGLPYLPERVVGRTSRDFDASEVLWEFFAQHARR